MWTPESVPLIVAIIKGEEKKRSIRSKYNLLLITVPLLLDSAISESCKVKFTNSGDTVEQ